MFDHDLDQTLLIVFGPLDVLFLFPVVMAWLEESINSRSSKRLRSWAQWMAFSRVLIRGRHR